MNYEHVDMIMKNFENFEMSILIRILEVSRQKGVRLCKKKFFFFPYENF